MDSIELLIHPVRTRLVQAMAGGRTRTTAELCVSLPDISKATIYRHVGVLADAGVFEVVDEQRVHGAVERRYRLRRERSIIGRDKAVAMSREDNRQAFAIAMTALMAGFNAYLNRDDVDLANDFVGYLQLPLWLSHDEMAEAVEKITTLLKTLGKNEPTPERSLYLISPILFPLEKPGQTEE